MGAELKKIFEKRLQETLKESIDGSGVKVSRGEIVVGREGVGNGRIGFRFLRNANGYILSAAADSPDFQDFYKKSNPPYKPKIPTGMVFAMNTSMEVVKSFSPNIGGAVDLPRNEEEVESTCRWICEKVVNIYFPRVINVVEVRPDLIRDVMDNPNYYSYPFLTIVFAARKNGIELSGLDVDYLLGKKVSGNRSFDENILKENF
ncbi:TPA: hypothetical protein QDC20_001146 [Burkholderia aenigmatica]|uniref:hypothetical protein n=1 Tax=Burkholderia sp. AU45251 TaxID=3059204 RepID=UPI00264E438E|nr:hypothetical protein [Burkholderia sp. AU45251]HDR9483833.1 hypothetical protein [Burkholderia aenigmatica]MDN7514778.1 hypothetical protein [Burkholderia sp. AU45251]HDR9515379.1 hypothetical protein [Burkholderia aenigmatica]HDR9592464.1 hypothetical protein [Burkholderia aenigmatica]HDR9601969.1 hypothetical protein [Burkholderia aenigmatica]